MNEWTVFTVIVAVIALISSVLAMIKPIQNLRVQVAELKIATQPLNTLNKSINEFNKNATEGINSINIKLAVITEKNDKITDEIIQYKEENHKSHKRLWDKTEEIDKEIANHETRIQIIESKIGA